MRGLDVHENIDVSDTKLMLGLRVCFICSDLTVNKLFPINPRVVTGPPKRSLLLEVESTSSFPDSTKLVRTSVAMCLMKACTHCPNPASVPALNLRVMYPTQLANSLCCLFNHDIQGNSTLVNMTKIIH